MPHPHPEHGHAHGHLGNPDDFAAYLAKLDDPSRAAWQKPGAVIDALRIRPRDVVAEIGAGTAYFTRRLARRAAHVFALEADPAMFPVLAARVAKLSNVSPVLVPPDAPRLPLRSVDLILMVASYHHLPGGPRYLKKLATLLRPGGRIANIDFHDRELPVGPRGHRISRERFLRDAARAGLRVSREHALLPYQYFVELKPARGR